MKNQTLHQRRLARESRFQWYGKCALGLALLALVVLLYTLIARGATGFFSTEVQLEITYDAAVLGTENADELKHIPMGGYYTLVQQALKNKFPDVLERKDRRELYALISMGATRDVRAALIEKPQLLGQKKSLWLPASSALDLYKKGKLDMSGEASDRALSDQQLSWIKSLENESAIRLGFNTRFFTAADSRQPEKAGFLGAMVGSFFTLMVCLALAFPLGVMTSVYLEEFARKNWFTDVIEVNINNLAAVPSIVFGLLGLSLYINVMHMPRSAPLVGGLTLALMILPVIIISTRTSLKAVPDSIRQGALALGATKLQTVWHHTLPLAMPGIMTGTILGLARAIGETAPLLMIGMVAFVADVPRGITDPATVMPVQVFLWATSPEAGFVEKTAAGIMVLLVLLLAMNALAIYLRKKFEVRW
jgi:phosphate transport system permease protein